MTRHAWIAALAFTALTTAGAQAQDLREAQTQACMSDAMRLCSDFIPDEGRISACMAAKRSELNPGCRAYFTDASTSGADIQKTTKVSHSKIQPISVR